MIEVFKTYNDTYISISGEAKVYSYQHKYIRKKRCNIINLFLTSSKSIEEFVKENRLALVLKYFINSHRNTN